MNDRERRFILATAGHVDHGKSALVKALTGIDPDRLPEEKARGITIELGFARLELEDPCPATPDAPSRYALGVVDVPGHEDFVKNMVSGVGAVDVALLVAACDDGWMPQTEEHFQILEYLGVKKLVVAATKCDLLEGNSENAIASIRARLQDSPFQDAPIVPVSARDGIGLDALKIRSLKRFEPRNRRATPENRAWLSIAHSASLERASSSRARWSAAR